MHSFSFPGLKVKKIAKNGAISSFLSGLKFAKIAKNRAISSFLFKVAKNRAISSLLPCLKFPENS